SGSLPDKVHAGYKELLCETIEAQSQSEDQELALLNYLLATFGQQRADRTLLNAPDYLASQRAFLGQNSLLHYQVSQFRTDAISSAQRRIAARLGFDGGLFNQKPEIEDLPFYVIEHAALLPQQPSSAYAEKKSVEEIALDGDNLTLTVSSEIDLSHLNLRQLLELQYTPAKRAPSVLMPACVVCNVDVGLYQITLERNALLSAYQQELCANPGKVTWCNSSLWLKDMDFPLFYLSDGNARSPLLTPTGGQQIVTVDNFPAQLSEGAILCIQPHLAPGRKRANDGDIFANVVEIDALRRQLLIQAQDGHVLPLPGYQGRYRWYIQRGEALVADRYSFTVSVVLPENLLLGEDSDVVDPDLTAAWVGQISREELPCHVQMEVHWLENSYFREFGSAYGQWLNAGAVMGLPAFTLLEQLALGSLPSGLRGINSMRIATSEQREEVFANGPAGGWNATVIEDNSLLYVPKAILDAD
ncbi:MAG: hypothetical protein K2Q15_03085, partial [Burkholderiales bacterium]|nr:hypothetical protein [Burkholderiales bacterium]